VDSGPVQHDSESRLEQWGGDGILEVGKGH